MNHREYPIVSALREFARTIASTLVVDGKPIIAEQTLPWLAANHILNLHSGALWEAEDRLKEIDSLKAEIEVLKARIAEYENKDR